MNTLGELWWIAAVVAVVAACATWFCAYIISGRQRKARQKLQVLVAEVLRETDKVHSCLC